MINNYWQRFLYLETKLKELSNYIQIDQRNFNVFSIEIMSLYLSTCSEIEAVYKAISNKTGQQYNFDKFRSDFSSIADKDLLLEYVSFRNNSLKFKPFQDIESKDKDQFISIKWWKDHNLIKHNSVHDKFHRTLILSGFCLLKIAKISLNSSFFPKPIKR